MDTLYALWLLALIVGLYFIPTIIATQRDVPNKWSVAVINTLLGWTLIGWAIALAMAVRDNPARQTSP